MGIFTKKEEQSLKYKKGDIGFTLKDKEKVLILKRVVCENDERNADLGPTYLVRGEDRDIFKLYECEILTLDELVGNNINM